MQALDVCDWEPLHVYLHSQCGERVGGGRNLMEVGIRGIKGQSLSWMKSNCIKVEMLGPGEGCGPGEEGTRFLYLNEQVFTKNWFT